MTRLFLIFGHLHQWKFTQYHNFCQSRFKILPNTKDSFEKLPNTFSFCQSGEISHKSGHVVICKVFLGPFTRVLPLLFSIFLETGKDSNLSFFCSHNIGWTHSHHTTTKSYYMLASERYLHIIMVFSLVCIC